MAAKDGVWPETISLGQLCSLTGLSDQRHRQIAQAGFFPASENGAWRTEVTLAGMIRYYRDLATKRSDDMSAEQLRQARADADVSEMKRDQRRGELFERANVLAAWQEVINELRDVVLTLDLAKEDRARIIGALRDIPVTDYGERKIKAGMDGGEDAAQGDADGARADPDLALG